ncbi:hypothetical protein [Pseudoruegeria sp. SHC-113]|uniref:hypothetical protein n=1 Tax=Pseudoruegeria sp. SHC-113 TaxID=2855439 RepID=UPI0021BA7C5C|nr:hypothetical protein [Pseudoruegeria sp. SHC-113]MCT8158501.1 hypothetical protein [Pseudoruegeria sp. SHC-113]
MKHTLTLSLALLLATLAAPASAACYADYKAKQDNPLRLHYGVAKLPDDACSKTQAADVLAKKLSKDGWSLLNVISVFDDSGLAAKRENAGDFYLRY